MKRFWSVSRVAAVFTIALALGAHATACGSDARSTDACRRVESERCAKAKACPTEFPDFTAKYGDVESCQRFYDVQCGRGVQDVVKEPSRSELDTCIKEIQKTCDAALTPEKYCPFLTANEPPVVVDTGTAAEAAAEAGSDAANDGG